MPPWDLACAHSKKKNQGSSSVKAMLPLKNLKERKNAWQRLKKERHAYKSETLGF
jgi:hypothetical protein